MIDMFPDVERTKVSAMTDAELTDRCRVLVPEVLRSPASASLQSMRHTLVAMAAMISFLLDEIDRRLGK